MIAASGLKIAIIYAACYAVAKLSHYAVYMSDAPIDISVICSIILSLSLIAFIVREGGERKPEKILIVSLFTSSALLIIQYILYFKAAKLVYDALNAIIDPILTFLTVVDIAAMIWISIDKSTNRLQRRDREFSATYNRSIFDLQAVRPNKAGN